MRICTKAFLGLAALVAAAPALTPDARAQDNWPSKVVRLIVPSPPGGGTDVFARVLAQALTDQLKQNFMVDNRPGGSGIIGAQAAAAAPPDGYTFLVSSNNSTSINQFLIKTPSFNVEHDLVGVSRGVIAVNVLAVYPSLGVKTLDEFVALAKRQPGALAFGTPGIGSSPYLGVRMIEEQKGLSFLHVPYKGMAGAYQDAIEGRVQFMYADLASALPYVTSGKLQVLASDRRSPLLPGVPTFAEAGWTEFNAPISFSVLAPAGVPQPILDRMAAEVGKALQATAPRLEAQALEPVFDTPAEFAASLAKERAMWGDFIRRNNITSGQ